MKTNGTKMDKKHKHLPFIITISYLVTLVSIRFMVFVAGSARSKFALDTKDHLPPGVEFYLGKNIILFGYHIHHFYIGIFLICVAGWMAIVGTKHLKKNNLAVIYGVGLGLLLDEIGLLLTWGNYYSSLSYVLSMILLGIFLSIVFFGSFWANVRNNLINVKSRYLIWNKFFNKNLLIKSIDKVSEVTSKTESTVLIFTGILYILVSVFMFKDTKLVRYWVAIIFIIHAATHFIRAIKNEDKEE